MALGPFCKALGIDEEVLGGQKVLTCDAKSLTNGVMWEIRRYKISKKFTPKDVVDWVMKICDLKCENETNLQEELNDKFEKLANLRNTLGKSPKSYRGEIERLMKWQFDLPQSMGVEQAPVFEPTVRANLGPKLLKVLKEKAGDDDDSIDMSGQSDDDDEQVKKRKAREEIIQLKKDLGGARKIITSLNDRLSDLSKRCKLLTDMSKSSVSERRRIESDIGKLKTEWNSVIVTWHDCIERLNHVNNNKGNYLDVGYMVRRNKTKQGIFDELNFEFERSVEEFKHKITSLVDKERRKKKVVSREYRQKSKTDRKRVRQESGEAEESKKICLSTEEPSKPAPSSISLEEFLKSEKVEEFKGGKFINSLKAIYVELTSMPIPCRDVQDVVYSVLSNLELINTEKIPSQSFAGNILMEARMQVTLQAYTDLIKMSKVSISNDSTTKFILTDTSYDVTLPDETHLVLGVRDITEGSPDTSLNVLKDIFGDFMNVKPDGNPALESLIKIIKTSVIDQHLIDKKLIEILFLYKQQMVPQLKPCLDTLPDTFQSKVLNLNNFCTGLYFLLGLAELADVTVLAWELMSQSSNASEVSKSFDSNQILSKTVQQIYAFCHSVNPYADVDDFNKEFNNFLKKDKKLDAIPLAPHKGNLFNTVFHNSAGLWFFHEIGILTEFFEKIKEKEIKTTQVFDTWNEKHCVAVARALGLIGKLVAVPIWTVLEDYDVEIGFRYTTALKKIESWSKDASKFMKGQERLFDDVPVSHDSIYVSLIKDNEPNDALAKELLELIFTAFVPYIKFFLYGSTKGFENNNMNGDTAMEVDSDTKPEIHQDFGVFDRITKNMHSASTYALDALMLYSKTRNGEWQDKLCSKNNLRIFELIQKNASKQLKAIYKRKIKLNEIKDQAQEGKNDEFSKCQLIEKRYKLIDDLIQWGGLWKSEKEIDEQLKDMKESDRMSALKAQIRFRRHVLCETHENGLLDLAFEGECFNSTKLYENLKAVLKNECLQTETDIFELASATEDESLRAKIYESCKNAQEVDGAESSKNYTVKENFHWLLGKLVTYTLVKGEGKESLSGVCIARKKVNGVYSYFIRYKEKDEVYKFTESKIAEDYKNKNLRLVEPTAKEMVGSRLSRAFFKDDGDLEWHDCRVIDVIGHGPEFVVEFDIYGSSLQVPDAEITIPEVETLTFTSHLLEDYRTERLRFL